MELEVIKTEVQVKPRVLTVNWSIEDMMALDAKRDKEFAHFKPYYKGKLRTTKQRNKATWINKLAHRHNRCVMNHRYAKQTERIIVQGLANEIRKEIDNEILQSILAIANEMK